MNIINITYDSTNYYLVPCSQGWIMIDTGWPGTLPKYLKQLAQRNIDIKSVKYLIVTHFHPDHAGLAQELKELDIQLVLHSCQIPYIREMEELFRKKPQYPYHPICMTDNLTVTSQESRAFLKIIGLEGELAETPGHSEDSISFILDGCCAFTGDLPWLFFADIESNPEIKKSWLRIQQHQVKRIHPGHGHSFELDFIEP